MLAAVGIAAALALIARWGRLLTPSGTIAATMVGAGAILGGMGWVTLLAVFFGTSSALSHWKRGERERLTGGMIEKGGPRDAVQVFANGAVFAAAALGATRGDVEMWQAIGAGAIAAATADTWSTEVGTVAGGTPRHLLSGRAVPPGTSGGVTVVGSLAALVGAILAAAVCVLMGWDVPFGAIVVGGVAGSLLDSLLGATIQERRWCTQCEAATERRIHRCGSVTMPRGGIPSCSNDIVNLMSVFAGAATTWILA